MRAIAKAERMWVKTQWKKKTTLRHLLVFHGHQLAIPNQKNQIFEHVCIEWEFVKKIPNENWAYFENKNRTKQNKIKQKSIERTHLNDESLTFAIDPFNSSKSAVNVTTEPLIAGAFDFTRSKKSREYATIVISPKADPLANNQTRNKLDTINGEISTIQHS